MRDLIVAVVVLVPSAALGFAAVGTVRGAARQAIEVAATSGIEVGRQVGRAEAQVEASKEIEQIISENRKALVEACKLEADLRYEIGVLKSNADEFSVGLSQVKAGLLSVDGLAKIGGPELDSDFERALEVELQSLPIPNRTSPTPLGDSQELREKLVAVLLEDQDLEGQTVAVIEATLKGLPISAADTAEMIGKFRKEFPTLLKESTRIYAQNLDKEAILAQIDFVRSPAGQRVTAATPKILVACAEAGRAWGERVAKDFK